MSHAMYTHSSILRPRTIGVILTVFTREGSMTCHQRMPTEEDKIDSSHIQQFCCEEYQQSCGAVMSMSYAATVLR